MRCIIMDIRHTAAVILIPSGTRELVTLVVLRRMLRSYKKRKPHPTKTWVVVVWKKNKINVFFIFEQTIRV